MKQNMAPWHRFLYGAGGLAAIGWGLFAAAESSRVTLLSLGAIGLIEAITGV